MRFSAFIRSVAIRKSWHPQCRSFQSSVHHFDPLRVLFCGSDDFSVASLEALNKERLAKSSADIESIDVVCRPGKPTGAGLKVIRHLPIRETAQQLELPLHEIDTFTGWQPPAGINLIIAVSFGLFVPPRILSGAKYGGLNIHPSMLPDLRGPAPIHWTILLDRKHTGVTLQTLHPQKIDHGTILAQTVSPGIPYSRDATTQDLISFMATKGANLLVKGLRDRVWESTKPIVHSEASILQITDGKGIAHAPKITPEDRHISSWDNMDAATILRKDRALGDLWDSTTYKRWMEELRSKFQPPKSKPILPKRVIFSGGFSEHEIVWVRSVVGPSDESDESNKSNAGTQAPKPSLQTDEDEILIASILDTDPQPGQLIFLPRRQSLPMLLILTSDDKFLHVKSCTIEAGEKDNGIKELWAAHEKMEKLEQNTQWTKEREEDPRITLKYQKLRLKLKEHMLDPSDMAIDSSRGEKRLADLKKEAKSMGYPDKFDEDFKKLNWESSRLWHRLEVRRMGRDPVAWNKEWEEAQRKERLREKALLYDLELPPECFY
ncbi:hypothetical protein FKW77_002561 [Venturia effusa]|uniref:methionyl-tRNA formyltransferase n=1 Tax=Venturia effusa TaxID=50376 RepID=A0A517LL10_9PEZI|nr:hypothetical protein FKW77_002561 [Venturia effusa]